MIVFKLILVFVEASWAVALEFYDFLQLFVDFWARGRPWDASGASGEQSGAPGERSGPPGERSGMPRERSGAPGELPCTPLGCHLGSI